MASMFLFYLFLFELYFLLTACYFYWFDFLFFPEKKLHFLRLIWFFPYDFLSVQLNLKRSNWADQKQLIRDVLRKTLSENMHHIYTRIPMRKCKFNKVATQHYWNHTLAWVFSCKFAAYFQNTFLYEHIRMAASDWSLT